MSHKFGSITRQNWETIAQFIRPECPIEGRTFPILAATSPHMRTLLQRSSSGLTIGCHTIRVDMEGEGEDEENDDGLDDVRCFFVSTDGGGGMRTTSNSGTDFNGTGEVPPPLLHRRSISANATPRKQGLHHRSHATSLYANDHCKLPLLDGGIAPRFALPEEPIDHDRQHEIEVGSSFRVKIAFSVIDSVHGEHQRSRWWYQKTIDRYAMFLRHAGFRGRGCHMNYITDALSMVHERDGSLLSLELSGLWFFTVFLEHLASSTEQLIELEHLSLQECHVFPTLDETVGELITKLPSLQSITLHLFDFSYGRAKQILEAASEHPCLRHVNINDNVFLPNAQSIVQSNVQSMRKLESFHINHLPQEFWNFGDFFAYKTNLRVLQLSQCPLSEVALRDLGHCLNVAMMLEELILNGCGITETLIEVLFPCIRRGVHSAAQVSRGGDGTPLMLSSPLMSGIHCIPNNMSVAMMNGSFSSGMAEGTTTTLTDGSARNSQEHSRNTSPAPNSAAAIGEALQLQQQQPPHFAGLTSSGGGAPHIGLGVNPFFQPAVPTASPPLLLMTVGGGRGGEASTTASTEAYNPTASHSSHAGNQQQHQPSFFSHTICAVLPRLKVLNLCDNPIGINGLVHLSAPISRMESLEQLYLAGCRLGVGEGIAESLVAALDPVISGLFVLDLSRNTFGDVSILEMCRLHFFEKLSANVAEVFMADNGMSREGIEGLLGQLQHASWLALLDVNSNMWRSSSPTAAAEGGAMRGAHIDPMAGETTSNQQESSSSLSDLLTNVLGGGQGALHGTTSSLHQLKLSHCGVPSELIIDTLCRVTETSTAETRAPLSCLHLSGLGSPLVDSTGGSTVPRLLTAIGNAFGTTLTSLDLSRNDLGSEAVSTLLLCSCAEDCRGCCVSCRLSGLRSLQLRRVGFKRLAKEQSPASTTASTRTGLMSLTELDMSANNIDRGCFGEICSHFLVHLTTLHRLDLSQNCLFGLTKEICERYPLNALRPTATPPAASTSADAEATQTTSDIPAQQTDHSNDSVADTDAPRNSAPTKAKGISNNKPTEDPNDALFIVNLRKRRLHVLSEVLRPLVVGITQSRGTLKRIKFDQNGLTHLCLRENGAGFYELPKHASSKALVGPLLPSDWYHADVQLPGRNTWDTFLLFSILVSGS